MIILSIFFFITAILYSSVGFGGGSTYLALLLIWNVPYYIFPVIALLCNIIVVSGNSFNYVKAGHHNFKLLIPFLIGSIPLAFLGGTLIIDKEIFEILLFIVLTVAGLLLLMKNKSYEEKVVKINIPHLFISFLIHSLRIKTMSFLLSLQIFLSIRMWLASLILATKIAPELSLSKVLVSVTVNKAMFTFIKIF